MQCCKQRATTQFCEEVSMSGWSWYNIFHIILPMWTKYMLMWTYILPHGHGWKCLWMKFDNKWKLWMIFFLQCGWHRFVNLAFGKLCLKFNFKCTFLHYAFISIIKQKKSKNKMKRRNVYIQCTCVAMLIRTCIGILD
jgi:hypothetical protein